MLQHSFPEGWNGHGEQIPLRFAGKYSDVRPESEALIKAIHYKAAAVSSSKIGVDMLELKEDPDYKIFIRDDAGKGALLKAYHCAAIETLALTDDETGNWHLTTFKRKLSLKRPGGQQLQTARSQSVRKAVLLAEDGSLLGWVSADFIKP